MFFYRWWLSKRLAAYAAEVENLKSQLAKERVDNVADSVCIRMLRAETRTLKDKVQELLADNLLSYKMRDGLEQKLEAHQSVIKRAIAAIEKQIEANAETDIKNYCNGLFDAIDIIRNQK